MTPEQIAEQATPEQVGRARLWLITERNYPAPMWATDKADTLQVVLAMNREFTEGGWTGFTKAADAIATLAVNPQEPVTMVRKLWRNVFVCPAGHQHRERRTANACPATKKARQ
jgi:hypothetical protein